MNKSNNTHAKVRHMTQAAFLAALIVVLQILSYFIKIGMFNMSFVLIPVVIGGMLLGVKTGAFLGGVFGVVVSIACITGLDAGGAILFAANPFFCILICLVKGIAAGCVSALVYKVLTKKIASRSSSRAEHNQMSRKIGTVAMIIGAIALIISLICFIGLGVVSGKVEEAELTSTQLFLALKNPSLIIGIIAIVAGALVVGAARITALVVSAALCPITNTALFCIGMAVFFYDTLVAWAGGTAVLYYMFTGLIGLNFVIELLLNVVLCPLIADTVIKNTKNKT